MTDAVQETRGQRRGYHWVQLFVEEIRENAVRAELFDVAAKMFCNLHDEGRKCFI